MIEEHFECPVEAAEGSGYQVQFVLNQEGWRSVAPRSVVGADAEKL